MLASVLANCHRDPKQRRKPYTTKDFLPPDLLREPEEEGPPHRKQERMALNLALTFGAPPEVMASLREHMAPPASET